MASKELELVRSFIEEFGDIDFPYENIIINHRKVYLALPKNKKLIETIPEDALRLGVFLGEVKKDFTASMNLIELIGKQAKKKIVLKEKQAWLFSCGRDVFSEEINPEFTIKKGKKVIVVNEKDEILGLAIHIKNKKEDIYKNILDLGDYLRREQKKRK